MRRHRGVGFTATRHFLMPAVLAFSLAALLAPSTGCRPARSAATPPRNPALKVNGVAISELEVAMETRRGHGAADSTSSRDQILDGLVLKEVMAQKAVALGLDRDEGLAERMERVEAQRASQRRKELANLFYRHEILDKVTATEQEARALYDQNQARIRAEVHVAQILTRDEAEAKRARAELQTGRSFDEVAARGYPPLPAGIKPPWDLGFLKWKNIPAEWHPALATLTPGQISAVIEGPGHRFWIIKLLEKRENREMTFARVKADLLDELRASKAEALRDRMERELLRDVKVEKLTARALPSTLPQTARHPAAVHAEPSARDDS